MKLFVMMVILACLVSVNAVTSKYIYISINFQKVWMFAFIIVAFYSTGLHGLPWMNSAPHYNRIIPKGGLPLKNKDERNKVIFTNDEMKTIMTSILESWIAERHQPSAQSKLSRHLLRLLKWKSKLFTYFAPHYLSNTLVSLLICTYPNF